jgi:hypothetical protein
MACLVAQHNFPSYLLSSMHLLNAAWMQIRCLTKSGHTGSRWGNLHVDFICSTFLKMPVETLLVRCEQSTFFFSCCYIVSPNSGAKCSFTLLLILVFRTPRKLGQYRKNFINAFYVKYLSSDRSFNEIRLPMVNSLGLGFRFAPNITFWFIKHSLILLNMGAR